jgi:hypothetical protein
LVCTARFGNGRLGSAAHHCDGLARYHELSQVKGYPFHPSEQDMIYAAPARRASSKAPNYSEFRNPSVSGSPLEAEDAEKAALGIEHPILHVAVYDGVESVNKIIELP